MNTIYSIVIPVYRSEETLKALIDELILVMQQIGESFELILVEDCSGDNTWKCVCDLSKQYKFIKGIRLSQNYGQLIATKCGILHAKGEYIITIDDDIEYKTKDIIKLLNYMKEQKLKLVYGIPVDERYNSFFNQFLNSYRNKFVFFLLSTQQMSSFKIFKNNELLISKEAHQKTYHFDVLLIDLIPKKLIGSIEVGKRININSESGYNFFKKLVLFIKIYPDYFFLKKRSVIYLSLLIFMLIVIGTNTYLFFQNILVLFIFLFTSFILSILISILLISIVLRKYCNLFRVPTYIIAEKTIF